MRLGSVRFTITPGLQFTLRRDTLDPRVIEPELVPARHLPGEAARLVIGYRFRKAWSGKRGHLPSRICTPRDFSAAIEFRLGRPWAKTAFLTGYTGRDLLFRPSIHEYFGTSTYAGVERKFGGKHPRNRDRRILEGVAGGGNTSSQLRRPSAPTSERMPSSIGSGR